MRGSTLSFSSISPSIPSPSRDYQGDLHLSEIIIHFQINIALEQNAPRILKMNEYDT